MKVKKKKDKKIIGGRDWRIDRLMNVLSQYIS